ncbi:MAG: His/Gly/Thr/Pro-type tRNA ligase C-terminal domain-containing protein [Candidatus Shikimatogenerans sp. AspAUS03]|uniref:His/Gly/Thr/Pro-type tRNA ligase C-terminal domain-containing protein n=1 Tax=Candidatus Shikimatogenerans sp. AspAUS03 TaxID=3158563 RepID=A0AAU7QSF5_9FLAO
MYKDEIISFLYKYGFILKNNFHKDIKSLYDYGHYGVLLNNNLKNIWSYYYLIYNNIYFIDTNILTTNLLLNRSKHIKNFNKYILYNIKNDKFYKIDRLKYLKYLLIKYYYLIKYLLKNNKLKKINLLFIKLNIHYYILNINLMFSIKSLNNIYYLRPEISQKVYINYFDIINKYKCKPPFGILQIGKSFRKEIFNKEKFFRMYEFEQMEMQYFVINNIKYYFKFWLQQRIKWYKMLNIYNIKIVKNTKLPHYALYSKDILFKINNVYKEIEGIHIRNDLNNFYIKKKNPYIIETSLGLNRLFYLIIINNLIKRKQKYILKIPFCISPIKCAFLPLIKYKSIIIFSYKIYHIIKYKYNCVYKDKKSIGKRYLLQDSIGTPFCITIDYITLYNKKITLRFRDNKLQKRICICRIYKYLKHTTINYFFKKNNL